MSPAEKWLAAHGGALEQTGFGGGWVAHVRQPSRPVLSGYAPTPAEAARKAALQALNEWGAWPVVDPARFEGPADRLPDAR